VSEHAGGGGGQDRRLLADGLGVPLNGLAVHDGALYVSEGGCPGRISRLAVDGGPVEVLVDGLPGGADYQYVLDFGRFEMRPGAELLAEPGTGALWRVPATAAVAAGKRPA
jgi:hypothetical protein